MHSFLSTELSWHITPCFSTGAFHPHQQVHSIIKIQQFQEELQKFITNSKEFVHVAQKNILTSEEVRM